MNKKTRPQYGGAEIITAIIYLCAMSAALMYVLCRQHLFVCTALMTAAASGVYMLFYAVRKRRLFAVLAFGGVFALILLLLSNRYIAYYFVDFVFSASEKFSPFMAGVSIFVFAGILGFTVCYFSAYLPRPAFLLLPSLIPLILSARTTGGLPAWMTVFISVGYALAALGTARPEFPKEIKYIDDKKSRTQRLAALGIFAAAAAVIIAAVPRDDNTFMGNYVDTVLRDRKTNFYGTQSLSNFANSSSVNRGANSPTEDVLFFVSAGYPTNVSRWSFDKYNGSEGWTSLSDYESGRANWENHQSRVNIAALVADLKRGAADGKLEKYADELKKLDNIPRSAQKRSLKMTIKVADGSSTKVVIHPNRTISAVISGYNDNIFRTEKDEIFTGQNFGQNASYMLEYYYEQPNEQFISMLTRVNFKELIDDALEEDVIEGQTRAAFLNEINRAAKYKKLTDADEIDPRIVELAEEITAGLSNDYEKACAIEKWFGEAGFVYDLDFVPAESTAEYFLFSSNRGICTDFATASTLLARAAGLPARYTEGFVLDGESMDDYGRYVVKASHAHAWGMCYVEGYGWLELDGTKYAAKAGEDNSFAVAALIFLAAAAAVIVLCVVFRRQLSEAFFAVSMLFRGENGRVRAIYLRTRRLACSINGNRPEASVSGEVRETISRSLGMPKEAEEITASADALLYGGEKPSVPSKRLYKDYRAVYKMKRRMKK